MNKQLKVVGQIATGLAVVVGLAWLINKVVGHFEGQHFKEVYTGSTFAREEKNFERTKKEAEVTPASVPANDVVMSYEQAVGILEKYLIGHVPQILGTCVAHSIKNAVRLAVKIAYGKDIDLAEGDIYIDRDTKALGIDSGMYTDKALERVASKGIAIRDIVPTASSVADLEVITRKQYPDNSVEPFRVHAIASHENVVCYKNFDLLWVMLTNEYKEKGLRPFQLTIYSYSGWWSGTDLPKATGYINGNHSCIGLVLPFMYGGKRAFFVFDSSYYKGKVWKIASGVRIVTEDTWNGLGIAARKLRFTPQIEAMLAKKTIPMPKTIEAVTEVAQKGNTGEAVIKIQKALMSLGYDIPAISAGGNYGYYGEQTCAAVKKWQLDSWEDFYEINPYWTQERLAALDGKAFGSVSIRVVNNQL